MLKVTLACVAGVKREGGGGGGEAVIRKKRRREEKKERGLGREARELFLLKPIRDNIPPGFPRALDLSSLHAQKSSGSRLYSRWHLEACSVAKIPRGVMGTSSRVP